MEAVKNLEAMANWCLAKTDSLRESQNKTGVTGNTTGVTITINLNLIFEFVNLGRSEEKLESHG